MNNSIISFTVSRPLSKKNMMNYGRGKVWKDPAINSFEQEVFVKAHNAILAQQWECTSNAVKIICFYNQAHDELTVTIRDLGYPHNKKRKKDLTNMFDTLNDKLQGMIYVDDKQIESAEIQEIR